MQGFGNDMSMGDNNEFGPEATPYLETRQIEQIRNAAEAQIGLPVTEVRLVHTYSRLHNFVALYDLKTERGGFHCVLSKNGEITLFAKRDK